MTPLFVKNSFMLCYILFICIMGCTSENTTQKKEVHHHISNNNATKKAKTNKSPSKTAMGNIGNAHIHITYNAPSVRGRVIWGGLVPLGDVWVAGAHNATSISTSEDIYIAGKKLKKGKYAFFVIPQKDVWTIIFNTNWKQHLADEYDEKQDVLRIDTKPISQKDSVEQLQYDVSSDNVITEKGKIILCWEKIKIVLEVTQR